MKFIMRPRWQGQEPRELTFDEVMRMVPNGWESILRDGFEKMFNLGWDGNISQIKEKFGTLRLYTECPAQIDDAIEDVIAEMEQKTSKVCNQCGEPATTTTKGWFTYVCDNHVTRND